MNSKRGFAASAIAGCAIVALFLAWMIAEIGGERATVVFGDIVQLLAAAAAAAACAVAARRSAGRARRAWFLLSAAVGCWALGQAAWSNYEVILERSAPSPSLADVGYLAWVPLAVLAMLAFSSAPESVRSRLRTTIDGLVVAGSLFFLSWAIVLGDVVRQSSGGVPSRVVVLAYPVGDIVVLTALLYALAQTRVRGAGMLPLVVIATGVVLVTLADTVYTVAIIQDSYATGNLADTGWVAGFLLIALAALLPTPSLGHDEARARTGSFRSSLPYSVAMAALVWAGVQLARTGSLDPVPLWNMLVIVALVLVRQMLALADRLAFEKDLSHMALHDPLTNLANRCLFYDRVGLAQAKMRRTGKPFTLAVLDLDDFKTVNDTLGHEAGDQLLISVAERLRGCVRAHDTLARLGGDEFAILMEETDDSKIPVEIGERALEAMRKPFVLRGKETIQAASIGVAVSTSADEPLDTLLHRADVAMYMAKAQGKDRVQIFDPQMLEAIG